MKWIAAAILVGALIVAAAIVATRPEVEVFETESAREAFLYSQAGWYCEVLTFVYGGEDEYRPINDFVLEDYATIESETGEPFDPDDPRPTFRCTRAVRK